jgi:hypothetical protein
MTTLAQILAIEKGEKNKTEKALTELHHKAEKPVLYEGKIRSYKPAEDGGEKLDNEVQIIQLRAKDAIQQMGALIAGLMDITATKDWANAGPARGTVSLEDGTNILVDAPVSYLLWLDKRLEHVETFITKMPTLDPSETWTWSSEQGCYMTRTSFTNRTKKTPKTLVKVPATDKHPAQTEVYSEDVVIGVFEQVRQSGAIPIELKTKLIARVRELKNAVRFAREKANSVSVEKQQVSKKIFDYLFAPLGEE